MLSFAVRIIGHVMLIGVAMGVFAAFRDSHTVSAIGILASDRVQYDLMRAGLLVGAWLCCLGVARAIDFLRRRPDRPHDPYEDHPKMSPSVQPPHSFYQDLAANELDYP